MKKLLVLLVMLFSFGLVACDSASVETYDYVSQEEFDSVEDQIAYLENQIALLEERIDNIVAVEGMNGQTVYYEKIVQEMSLTLNELNSANFNSDIAPTYMYDENGNYVTFDSLGLLLQDKYFADCETFIDNGGHTTNFSMIPYASFIYYLDTTDVELEDLVARIILMVEEIANYEYYSLSSNGIEIVIYMSGANRGVYILTFEIPTVVLINDMFTLNYDSIAGDEFESNFDLNAGDSGITITFSSVESYYNNYVLNGTYDGYVLNYSE